MEISQQNYHDFQLLIEKYGHMYSKFVLDYIKEHFETDLELVDDYHNSTMNQIYAYLKMIPDNRNIYKTLFNIVKEKIGVDKNILNIGGGYIPMLSKYIDEEQQRIRKGTITVYDPKLILSEFGKIKLYREELAYYDDCFSKYDVFIGSFICDATELVIRKSKDKELLLTFCDCIKSNHDQLFNLLRKTTEDGFDLLIDEFTYPYPIAIKTRNNRSNT